MFPVYLSLGSNLGNRLDNLVKAVRLISSADCRIAEVASVYESEPVGFSSEHLFLNTVVKAETNLRPIDLLKHILKAETLLGRVRNGKGYSDRVVDADILFFGNEIINKYELVIPHPRLQDRLFVLAPLAEISPELMHPVLKKSASELHSLCPEQQTLAKFMHRDDFWRQIMNAFII